MYACAYVWYEKERESEQESFIYGNFRRWLVVKLLPSFSMMCIKFWIAVYSYKA